MKNLFSVSILLIFFLFACNDDDDNDEPRPANEVGMSANSFLPANLEVSQGTTVRWLNNSTMMHNVVSETGLFNQTLNPGQSFSFAFNEVGVFNYECTLHPGMTGSITVVSASGFQNGPDDIY